jgi:hypothetical protein
MLMHCSICCVVTGQSEAMHTSHQGYKEEKRVVIRTLLMNGVTADLVMKATGLIEQNTYAVVVTWPLALAKAC